MSKNLTTNNNHGFVSNAVPDQSQSVLAQAQTQKAVQEVQAALTMAAARPRDQLKSYERIMQACDRPTLADQAIYTYPRGGTNVSGASIRLAEVLIQNWGNAQFGYTVLSRRDGMSEVEAYAWDFETNVRTSKIFQVEHVRDTKQGKKKLNDSRDINEMEANQAARRVRACILAIIPGDIVDAALERCVKTQSSGKEPLQDRLKKMVSMFNEIGVQVDHIEKRLGHNLSATIEAEMVTLRGIYKSIKDGMAKREDYFDISGATGEATESVKDLIANKGKPEMDKPETEKEEPQLAVDPETGEVLPPEFQ